MLRQILPECQRQVLGGLELDKILWQVFDRKQDPKVWIKNTKEMAKSFHKSILLLTIRKSLDLDIVCLCFRNTLNH